MFMFSLWEGAHSSKLCGIYYQPDTYLMLNRIQCVGDHLDIFVIVFAKIRNELNFDFLAIQKWAS